MEHVWKTILRIPFFFFEEYEFLYRHKCSKSLSRHAEVNDFRAGGTHDRILRPTAPATFGALGSRNLTKPHPTSSFIRIYPDLEILVTANRFQEGCRLTTQLSRGVVYVRLLLSPEVPPYAMELVNRKLQGECKLKRRPMSFTMFKHWTAEARWRAFRCSYIINGLIAGDPKSAFRFQPCHSAKEAAIVVSCKPGLRSILFPNICPGLKPLLSSF